MTNPQDTIARLREAAQAVLDNADRPGSRMHFESGPDGEDVWIDNKEVDQPELDALADAIAALSVPNHSSVGREAGRYLALMPAEIQSGLDRVRWAEGLICQLPDTHDGRNSWLLNYGTSDEAAKRRTRYSADRANRGLPPAEFQLDIAAALLPSVPAGVSSAVDEARLVAWLKAEYENAAENLPTNAVSMIDMIRRCIENGDHRK